MQKRNYNILSHIKREISLSTRIKKIKANTAEKQNTKMRQ